MDWLNYHHLLYFWVVAREGTIARACDQLHLTQPSISKQLHQLEHSVGEKLFKRVGRNLVLTETGQAGLPLCRGDFLARTRAERDSPREAVARAPATVW